jgi:hypothetical protein
MTFTFPGPVDMARATADANRVLAAIDWSRRDIVVWVPGTDGTTFMPKFAEGMRAAWQPGEGSAVSLDYQATWHLDTSEPTGEAALRLLLAGIEAHAGQHRVLLAGLSQGAWIISDVLADPRYRRTVTRAIMFGHPQVSLKHFHDDEDPQVREISHPNDIIAMPITGPRERAIEAMTALQTGAILPNLGLILSVVLANPKVGTEAIVGRLRGMHLLPKAKVDNHDYDAEYGEGAKWLHDGPAAATQAVVGAAGVSRPAASAPHRPPRTHRRPRHVAHGPAASSPARR